MEGYLRSNLVSFSSKEIDEQKYKNESGASLLTVFTATKLDVDFSISYYLIDRFSVSLGYIFDLSRINKWDPYIAASNSIIISINVRI